jgi:hypothetical protein
LDGVDTGAGGMKPTGMDTDIAAPLVEPGAGLKYSTNICGVMLSISFAELWPAGDSIARSVAATTVVAGSAGIITFGTFVTSGIGGGGGGTASDTGKTSGHAGGAGLEGIVSGS